MVSLELLDKVSVLLAIYIVPLLSNLHVNQRNFKYASLKKNICLLQHTSSRFQVLTYLIEGAPSLLAGEVNKSVWNSYVIRELTHGRFRGVGSIGIKTGCTLMGAQNVDY